MADNDEELWRMTTSEDLNFVNHNDTDYTAFNEFQKKLNETFEKVEEENLKKTRKANLELWDRKLAPRWEDAVLPKIKRLAARKVEKKIEKEGLTNIYLTGNSGSGKTFIAYAIIKRWIGLGLITPSQVKIVSEDELMGYAALGFEGQARFEKLFNRNFKVYFFDGVGNREKYSIKELQIWEHIINHIYDQSLIGIFTSNSSPTTFSDLFSDSTASKISYLFSHDGVVSVEKEDEEIGGLFPVTNKKEENVDDDEKVLKIFS